MKILQNGTVFVISLLVLKEGGCKCYFIFMKEVPASKKVGNLCLRSGWANSGPRAKCGPPQRFQWLAQAFTKIVKSEISSKFS